MRTEPKVLVFESKVLKEIPLLLKGSNLASQKYVFAGKEQRGLGRRSTRVDFRKAVRCCVLNVQSDTHMWRHSNVLTPQFLIQTLSIMSAKVLQKVPKIRKTRRNQSSRQGDSFKVRNSGEQNQLEYTMNGTVGRICVVLLVIFQIIFLLIT